MHSSFPGVLLSGIFLALMPAVLPATPEPWNLPREGSGLVPPEAVMEYAVLDPRNGESPADIQGMDTVLQQDFLDTLSWGTPEPRERNPGSILLVRVLISGAPDSPLPFEFRFPSPPGGGVSLLGGRDPGMKDRSLHGVSGTLQAGEKRIVAWMLGPGSGSPVPAVATGSGIMRAWSVRAGLSGACLGLGAFLAAGLVLMAIRKGGRKGLLGPAFALAWAGACIFLGQNGADSSAPVSGPTLPDPRLLFLAGPFLGGLAFGAAREADGERQGLRRFWISLGIVDLLVTGLPALSGLPGGGAFWNMLAPAFALLHGCSLIAWPKAGSSLPGVRTGLVTTGIALFLCAIAGFFLPMGKGFLPWAGGMAPEFLWLLSALAAGLVPVGHALWASGKLRRQVEVMTSVVEQTRQLLEKTDGTLHDREKELDALRIHDAESGFLKEAAFRPHLDRELHRFLRYGTHFSILVVEMDHPGVLVDPDPALAAPLRMWFFQTVASRVRDSDIVVRHGDWSLLVFLPETTPDNAMLAAENIRALVRGGIGSPPGTEGRTRASLGVTGPRKGVTDGYRLLQELDDTLARARKAGGNRVALGLPGMHAPGEEDAS